MGFYPDPKSLSGKVTSTVEVCFFHGAPGWNCFFLQLPWQEKAYIAIWLCLCVMECTES